MSHSLQGWANERRAMKLLLLGATGPTGLLVVEKARAAGHEVTVLARDPRKLAHAERSIRIERGDALDAQAVERAVKGHDAVISCLGTTRIRPPVRIFSSSMRHVLSAMQHHDVRRLIVVSSGGVDRRIDWSGRLLFEFVLKPIVFRYAYADMRAMEALVMASTSEWTILRPPELTDGIGTGVTLEEPGAFKVRGHYTLPRADLAETVVRKLEDSSSIRQAIAVAGA